MSEKEPFTPPPEWEQEDRRDEALAAYLRSIGAKSLAAEIDDLRFRTRMIESQHWIDDHLARMSAQEALQDTYDRKLIANQASLFEKSQAYNNVILTLGYAGMFAIWNFIRDQMDPWDMKLIALLIGSSLVLFIGWTIFQMVLIARAAVAHSAVLAQVFPTMDEHIEAITECEAAVRRGALRFQRVWLWIFIPTVVLGFAAAVCLLSLLLAGVLEIPFALHQIPSRIGAAVSRLKAYLT